MFRRNLLGSSIAAIILASGSANAAVLVATYTFNDTLAGDGVSAPTLVSIDPLGLNGFETAIVNGQSQRVFRWNGDGSDSTLNAGLQLDATGLVAYNNYSVELTFEFLESAAFGGGWRRIMDTQNRQSDNGFYVAPENTLNVYPEITGSSIFTTPGFHNVVLTNFVVNGVQEVKAYLNGNLEMVSNTDQLNLDNANNPGHLLQFFVDNLVGPAQNEFADGRIASLRIYDGVIVPSQIPLPGGFLLFSTGLLSFFGFARRKNL
ncbi:MAG: hypothetical protein BVN35_09115 [Proteobacteria bacterium ST_bin11]|jgi:hypothetical protein|nr:MAG: hypothetical protein BVN35_09115 [Proteobacteria bacterium ST_bin11]